MCVHVQAEGGQGEMRPLQTANGSQVFLQHNESLPTPQAVSPGAWQTLTFCKYEFELEP